MYDVDLFTLMGNTNKLAVVNDLETLKCWLNAKVNTSTAYFNDGTYTFKLNIFVNKFNLYVIDNNDFSYHLLYFDNIVSYQLFIDECNSIDDLFNSPHAYKVANAKFTGDYASFYYTPFNKSLIKILKSDYSKCLVNFDFEGIYKGTLIDEKTKLDVTANLIENLITFFEYTDMTDIIINVDGSVTLCIVGMMYYTIDFGDCLQ